MSSDDDWLNSVLSILDVARDPNTPKDITDELIYDAIEILLNEFVLVE